MRVSVQGHAHPASVRRLWSIAVALLLAGLRLLHAAEPNAAVEPVAAAHGPTLKAALGAARVALDSCKTKGFAVSVSIVDAAGVPKVLLAGDGVAPRGVRSSTNKALTALAFKDSTSRLATRSQTDKPLAEAIAADSNYTTRAGGIVIKVDGEIIGAIGVGGAHPSEVDESCALNGLENINRNSARRRTGAVQKPAALPDNQHP
jgi:uncharacterized protein GlcG (DUF336 family)